MPELRLKVSASTKAQLDACAPLYGGRAALLRQLLQPATGAIDPPSPPKQQMLRTFVRLTAEETAAVAKEANAMGLRVSPWIAALIRRRIYGEPRFPRREELALFEILAVLHGVGRELAALARQAKASGAAGPELQGQLAAFQAEVKRQVSGVRAAFAGNLAYWDASGGR